MESISNKTILLTGATGFIGNGLLHGLVNKRCRMIAPIRDLHCRDLSPVLGVDYVEANELDSVFGENEFDAVVHTACLYDRDGVDHESLLEANLMLGIRLLELCERHSVPLFVNTDTTLPSTVNAYALSKKQFRDWLKLSASVTRIVNMRLDYVYGAEDATSKLVPWFLSQLRAAVEEIPLTEGEQLRDFVHLADVVEAYSFVLNRAQTFGNYTQFDVGTGQLTPLKEFLLKLFEAHEVKFGPSKTRLGFGSIPYRDNEIMQVDMNVSVLKELGWSAKFTAEEGAKLLVG